jgi:hypothetical protein
MRPALKKNPFLVSLAVGAACASSLLCLTPEASAKWVRVSVQATLDEDLYMYTSTGSALPQTFSPSFILRDYTDGSITSTNSTWTQAANTWDYYPLFDFGTLTNTAGFYGSFYEARNTTGSFPDKFLFNSKASLNPGFQLYTSRADSATGYNLYTDISFMPSLPPSPDALSSFFLNGNITNFNANQTTTSIATFVQTALGTNVTSRTYNCYDNTCTGAINTASEAGLTFTWDAITFEMIEPVPSPLPLAGGASAFAWARKLRRRSQAASSIEQS